MLAGGASPLKHVYTAGGGSKNSMWCEMRQSSGRACGEGKELGCLLWRRSPGYSNQRRGSEESTRRHEGRGEEEGHLAAIRGDVDAVLR